ncbi:MAG: helix-turn-helix transcriptional regulator [Clostridiales bacterium]|nr:helix-turn-helix transcriptional regulator [Clostridiales bacterium]
MDTKSKETMKDFELAKALIGDSVTEEDLKYVDCYPHTKVGLFIPSLGPCNYANKPFHNHPSYMFIIVFSKDALKIEPCIEIKENHYFALATSPNIPHEDEILMDYYCILINKEYFEEQYKMYTNDKPDFKMKEFVICHDILKALNTFAFEHSKKMKNADITLEAQTTIITHWIIRSILGHNYDMRAISSNYAVARAEQYIEQHYSENITVKYLAKLVNMSVSSFNRIFKKETKLTPIEYLIELRIEKSKKLLRREELSITEIAIRCGFNSSAHFSSSFSRLLNTTPSNYRKFYCN